MDLTKFYMLKPSVFKLLYFMVNTDKKYGINGWAEEAGISYHTVKRAMDDLLYIDVIKKEGKKYFYENTLMEE